jgi:glutamine synthetase
MTTLADPVPGGRPGDVERATALSGELAGRGVHGVVLAYVDTAGIGRVKAVPTARLAAAAAWGVGMSPVFDTFLANDSIVTTDVLGSPDGDLRLYPDLDQLVVLAGQPGWAWAPVDRVTQDGERHPGCTRTLLRRMVTEAVERHGLTFKAAIEIEWTVARGDAPGDAFVPATTGPAYGAARQVELGVRAWRGCSRSGWTPANWPCRTRCGSHGGPGGTTPCGSTGCRPKGGRTIEQACGRSQFSRSGYPGSPNG